MKEMRIIPITGGYDICGKYFGGEVPEREVSCRNVRWEAH
jgi:hypothetical protein